MSLRACLLMLAVVSLAIFSQPSSAAEPGSRPDGIRTFLQQGQYDLAISTAHEILSQPNLPDQERYELLSILAEAEEKLAQIRHYTNVEMAIRTYEDLHKEFPKKFSQDKLQWKIAWLSWNKQDFDRADTAAKTILQNNSRNPETKKAALLHARHLIRKKKFAAARSVLLMYFGLNPDVSASEEAEGMIWLAVINAADHRTRQAYKTMQKIHASHPDVIENNSLVYATYIRLIAQYSGPETSLPHINRFIKKYITAPEAPEIRLLQADALVEQKQLSEAETVYGILADRHSESVIGKKSSMRQLMLKLNSSRDKETLQQAIATLSNLASKNQLSDIETEAQLYQARLWGRLGRSDPEYSNRALAFYALAASAENAGFVAPAQKEGAILLNMQLHKLLAQQQWLNAVVLWKRYPQLRPDKGCPSHTNHASGFFHTGQTRARCEGQVQTDRLAFGIAQAYIRLMDYASAEDILAALYQRAKGTVRGQRIMLERARLWAEREDTDSVRKIMHWLASHEQTLYRQDMLLIAASAQNRRGKASMARQTLAGIAPEDLTPELRHDYWRTRARINLALKNWHTAADAWRRLAESGKGKEKWRYVRTQAEALIQSKDYMGAEKVLLRIPDAERHDAWHFSLALCALNTGRWKKAEGLLIPLSEGGSDKNYAMRARLLLAEKHSEQVIMAQQ